VILININTTDYEEINADFGLDGRMRDGLRAELHAEVEQSV
jgi:hypothetical protein